MRMRELEGRVIAERFRLEKMVGKGGYGAVFEATQLSVGRRCAVKVLLPHRSDDEAVEKRFRAEARSTSRLTHPNSLVLYDFGVDEATGFLFLATEFLDGHTLHRVLKLESHLSVKRSVSILTQVGASLADAHEHGLVHRDIKPKNIMLVHRAGQRDFVKVIDFGIAKALSPNRGEDADLTRTGMILGTPQYMAPEQLLAGSVDGRTDQYALAVVGYRMLTGRNPFRAGAPMETAMRHINDRPLPLRTYRPELEVPAEFEDAFLTALQKSPEHRFDDITEFVEALLKAVETVADDDEGEDEDDADQAFSKSSRRFTEKTLAIAAEHVDAVGRDGGLSAAEDMGTMDSGLISPVNEAPVGGTRSTGAMTAEVGGHISQISAAPVTRQRPARQDFPTGQNDADDEGRDILPWLVVAAVASCFFFSGVVIALVVTADKGDSQVDAMAAEEQDEATEPRSTDEEDREQGQAEVKALASAIGEVDGRTSRAFRRAHGEADERARELEASQRAAADNERDTISPATVTVTLIPWGTLYVDDAAQTDQTRQSVELSPGEYELTLRQQGEVRARRLVDVQPGESKMVVLEADFAR